MLLMSSWYCRSYVPRRCPLNPRGRNQRRCCPRRSVNGNGSRRETPASPVPARGPQNSAAERKNLTRIMIVKTLVIERMRIQNFDELWIIAREVCAPYRVIPRCRRDTKLLQFSKR